MNRSSKAFSKNIILIIISVFYVIALLSFKLFRKTEISGEVFYWVPFSVHYAINPVLFIIVNLVIAIPLGLVIAYFWKKNILMIVAGVVFCFALEFLPAIFKIGYLDTTTIITYILGMAIGYLIVLFTGKKQQVELGKGA